MIIINVNWQFYNAGELWEELQIHLISMLNIKDNIHWGKTVFEKDGKIMIMDFHTENYSSLSDIPVGCFPLSGTAKVYMSHHNKKYFVYKVEVINLQDYRPEKVILT